MAHVVACGDQGYQGVDPGGGVSRQGEADVLVIGACLHWCHSLHPAQGLPLEHDFPGNGDGDGQVLSGADGAFGGQGEGCPWGDSTGLSFHILQNCMNEVRRWGNSCGGRSSSPAPGVFASGIDSNTMPCPLLRRGGVQGPQPLPRAPKASLQKTVITAVAP